MMRDAFRGRTILFLFALLLLPVGAVTGRAAPDGEGAGGRGRSAGREAWIGLDRFDPWADGPSGAGRIEALGGLGPMLMRTTEVAWGRIEPHAPVMGGRHLRDFTALDRFVVAWGRAGFEVVIVLSPASSWASQPAGKSAWRREVEALPAAEAAPLETLPRGATPPLALRWEDWRRFVRAVVERYDGDGRGDVAGLVLPIRWIQILEDPADPACWMGSPADYAHLLHEAGLGAGMASADVQVVHGDVDLGDLRPGGKIRGASLLARSREQARALVPATALLARRKVSFPVETLGFHGLVGAVAQIGRPNLDEEAGALSTLAGLLLSEGQLGVEPWLVGSPLGMTEAATIPHASAPSPQEQRLRARWLAAARDSAHADHARALAWRRRGEAYDVVRTLLAARVAGARRVFFAADAGEAATAQDDPFVGPGEKGRWVRRPAWYALEQARRALAGAREITVEPRGDAGRLYRVRFDPGHRPPWMLVAVPDPGRSWAGDPTGREVVTQTAVRVPAGRYVTGSVRLGPGEAVRTAHTVSGAILPIELTVAPLYLWPGTTSAPRSTK